MDIQEFHESMRRKYRESEERGERMRRLFYHYLLVVAIVSAMGSAKLAYWIVTR
jgi:hypothetical protein